MNPIADTESTNFNLNWLYAVSGAATLILGLLFLVAIISLIAARFLPGTLNARFALFQNNWLVVLFKLNAGYDGIQFDRLYGLNTLDITIILLVAMMVLGLYPVLRRTSRFWSLVAVVIPLLGIILFIGTKLAGRSGVMGAVLVISFIMLRNSIFARMTAILGILASALLLTGDVGTKANSQSTFVAILVGIGYVLLMIWFFLVSRWLFHLRHSGSKEMEYNDID